MDRIIIGPPDDPLFVFDDDGIEAASTAQAVALMQQELSIDTFTPVVRASVESTLDVTLFLSSDGKKIVTADGQIYALSVTESDTPSPLIELPDGTPVYYYHNEELVGKFYLKTVTRQAKNKYRLECVSAVGRLDRMQHGGGLYLTATVGEVLESIMVVPSEE